MSDLISRDDAIRELSGVCSNWEDDAKVAEIINALPSVEAVQGEWTDIDDYYRMATCSLCHKVTMFEKWGEYTKPYDFCPNCGAKMKGGGDE